MTLRTFLLGSFVGALLGWLVWAGIVIFLDPVQAGSIGFILFFLALFLAIASSASLLGFGVRRLISGTTHPAYAVRPSLRQGLWLSIFVNVLLIFQLLRLSQWWLTLIFILFFLFLELIFISYDKNTRRTAETEERGTSVAE